MMTKYMELKDNTDKLTNMLPTFLRNKISNA